MYKTKNLLGDLNVFRKKVPLMVEWEAWIGKTSIIEEFSKNKNIKLHKVLSSSMDETDIAWIIIHDKETNSAKTISPILAQHCQEECVVFFDELNTARKEVQDTLLTLIQSREFPNWDTIHPGVRFIAAINGGLSYNNYEMSPAMQNRFAWVKYVANEKKFATYLKKNIDKNKEEIYSIIIEWLTNWWIKFTQLDDEDGGDEIEHTITSPRSLSNLLTTVNNIKELLKYCGSFVDNRTCLYLKTINKKDKKWVENEVFDLGFKWLKKNKTKFIR